MFARARDAFGVRACLSVGPSGAGRRPTTTDGGAVRLGIVRRGPPFEAREVRVEIIVALQTVGNPFLDAVALALTNLGSEQAYVALLVVGYLAVDARATRIVGLGLLGGYYVNQLLKEAFDTARPYLEHPELLRSEAAGLTAPGPAFPSGHAQSAATFWGLVAAVARRGWVTWTALALIFVIGATRVYLGVHWPVDVVGGWALGAATVAVVVLIVRWRPGLSTIATVIAFVVVPVGVHLALTTPESGLIAGAFAGFGTAPLLHRHEVRGGLARRMGLALLGLALVFAWLIGTSVLLPEAVKGHALVAPARYLLLAWAGLVAAPWLGARLGVVPRTERT